MGSSEISTRKGSLGMEFLKQTAGYITGATGSYFKQAMPVIGSTISEAKLSIHDVQTKLKDTSQSILPKVRQLKVQSGIRGIYKWFTNKEDEFSMGDDGGSLDFDIPTDNEEVEAEISEFSKGSNKISSAVVESTHQMVESQLISTANIQSTLDKQSAVISAGFDKTNSLLSNLLEVVTNNTATLIETSVVSGISPSREKSSNDQIISDKFSLSQYKKAIGKNIRSDPTLGMISAFLPMLTSGGMVKEMISPQSIIEMAVGFGLNKLAPNLKKNMKVLDDVVNDTIMSSLIRLGEKNNFGTDNTLSRIFGLDSSRKKIDTSRNSLEIKAVPFDTITKESITNAIPGYLRKILVALGGEDSIYDYRSRKFVSKKSIKREYRNKAASTGNIYRASSRIRDKFDTSDDFTSMTYDLMMNDLGSKLGRGGNAGSIISSFGNREAGEKYIIDTLYQGKLKGADKEKAKEFAKILSELPKGYGEQDILLQASKNNISRNSEMGSYMDELNNYNIDASFINDSSKADSETIKKFYGRRDLAKKDRGNTRVERDGTITVSGSTNVKNTSGLNYTNIALYEIFRRLNTGINVFRVGASNARTTPYEKFDDSYLPKPKDHRAKIISDRTSNTSSFIRDISSNRSTSSLTADEPNLLQNQNNEDGTSENLSKGKRVGRWAKSKGGSLIHAMFNGSAGDVKDVFDSIIKDVEEVGGDSLKKGASHINTIFGNVSGYLHHKMFGTAYSYKDIDSKTGEPIIKHVAGNEKKGIFGFITDGIKETFEGSKEKVNKWFSDVAGYFDYGDKDPEEKGIAGKRKALIKTSIGALGGGILAGPLGLLVGGIAGNAFSVMGLGPKVKNFLFGHNENTGKPTGLISKTIDGVISPIRFQIGKTATFAASLLKKNILGPLSDIGLSIRDRIHNHIDTAFDKFKSTIGKGAKFVLGGIVKGAAKLGAGISTIGRKVSTTAVGKVARGAMGAVSGAIGFTQNRLASKIAGKGSFHKLKSGETYPLLVGEKYRDPSDDKKIKTLGESNDRVSVLRDMPGNPMGIWLDGDNDDEYQPRTKDYLKWRSKQRKKEIDNDLARSGFYGSGTGVLGKVKGFFGGDYKKWHEEDLMKRKNRRDKFNEYVSERQLTKEEIEAMEAEKEMAETTSEISRGVQQITGEIIPGSSFKTHDQGIHDRLDQLISLLGGNKDEKILKKKEESSITNNDDNIVGSIIGASATITSGDDILDSDESNLQDSLFDAASKENPDKRSMLNKLRQLAGLKKNKKKEESEKKESIFSKILSGIGSFLPSILKFGGAALGLYMLFKNADIGNILSNIGSGIKTLIGFITGNKKDKDGEDGDSEGSGNPVVDTSLALTDTKVDSVVDIFNPFKTLKHIDTDAAGNDITNTASTNARNQYFLENTKRKAWNKLTDSDIPMMGEKGNSAFKNRRASAAESKRQRLRNKAERKTNKAVKLDEKGKSFKSERKLNEAQALQTKANNITDDSFLGNHSTIRGASNLGSSLAVGQVAGNLAGTATSFVTDKLGMNNTELGSTASQVLSNAANVGVNFKVTKNALINKGLSGKVKNALMGVLDTILTKVTELPILKKVGSTKISKLIKPVFDKVKSKIGTLGAKAMEKAAVIMGKESAKAAGEVVTAGIGAVALGVAGAISGMCTVENLFGIPSGQADFDMKAIATGLGALFMAVPYVGLVEILDPIFVTITGTGIRQWLAQTIYSLSGGESKLTELQGNLKSQTDAYNKKHGTNLSTIDFNDMTNRSTWSQFWNGKTKTDEKGNIQFKDDGSIDTTGGVKGFFGGIKDFFTGKSKSKSESEITIKDKDGKPIKDKDGKTVNQDSIANWASASIISGPIGMTVKIAKELGDAASEWNKQEDLLDENGKPIKDSKGKSIKKKSLKSYLLESMRSITSSVITPINDMTKTNLSQAKATISSNINSGIANGIMNGNGILGSTISGVLGGIKKSFSGSGGPDENDLMGNDTTSISDDKLRIGDPSSSKNPLSKNAKVTSSFGPRAEMGGFHRGVDLIPADGSKNADVNSQFDGTIVSVKNNVSDSDTGHPYKGKNSGGNSVKIQTPDGTIIGNYHLKAGSIPSSIKPGTSIKAGQRIGSMGSTGHSTGEHLHYQIEKPDKNGNLIPFNPMAIKLNKSNSKQSRIGDPSDITTVTNNGSGEFEKWISIIVNIKKQIADAGRGYSIGGNMMNLSANGYSINSRTDCSGFVQSCVSCLVKKNVSLTSRSIVGDNSQLKSAGFIKMGWPGWEGLYQGDIIAENGHTEIFSHNDGGKHYVWNCGSDSSCNNPNPTPSSKDSYNTVWRHKDSNGASIALSSVGISSVNGFSESSITGTDGTSSGASGFVGMLTNLGSKFLNTITGGLLGNNNSEETSDSTINEFGSQSSLSGNIDIEEGAEGMYKYLKSLGYSDQAAAGVVACFQHESNNNPKRVEADYLDIFKQYFDGNYDNVGKDYDKFHEYTNAVIARTPAVKDGGAGYVAQDGRKYAGLGYAQWTADRAKALLEFAKNHNVKWYEPATQLSFLDQELQTSYKSTYENLKNAKDVESATHAFAYGFEHGKMPSNMYQPRLATAKELYSKFTGSAVGGPNPEDEMTIENNNLSRIGGDLPEDYNSDNERISNRFSIKEIKSSNITNPNSHLDKITSNKKSSTFVPKLTTSTNNSINRNNSSNIIPINNENITNNKEIVNLLYQVLQELRSITNNTGSSSDLLEELNQKDFVDQGLRDSISAVSKSKKSPNYKMASGSNIGSISAMARP